MGHLRKLITGVGIAAVVVMLGAAALLWLIRTEEPPVVSIELLGYTNRIGPHAILAITNCSRAAITLDPQCLVAYTATRGIEPRRPGAFEASKTAVTRLKPNSGFVQEVFVFPASKGEWQFESYAAYSSVSFEMRRSIENRFGKLFRRIGLRPTSKAWHKINTEWRDCPP
jgi:hypothetical protein